MDPAHRLCVSTDEVRVGDLVYAVGVPSFVGFVTTERSEVASNVVFGAPFADGVIPLPETKVADDLADRRARRADTMAAIAEAAARARFELRLLRTRLEAARIAEELAALERLRAAPRSWLRRWLARLAFWV